MLVPTLNYFCTYLPNKLRQLYNGTGFSLLSLKKFTAENFSQSCTVSFVSWPLLKFWLAKYFVQWRNK